MNLIYDIYLIFTLRGGVLDLIADIPDVVNTVVGCGIDFIDIQGILRIDGTAGGAVITWIPIDRVLTVDRFGIELYKNMKVEEKLNESRYEQAKRDMSRYFYARALEGLKACNGFKDSAELIKNNMILAALISTADDQTPAKWKNDKVNCPKCKEETASFSLTFSTMGEMISSFDCTKHTTSDKEKQHRYRYKIENNMIRVIDYDGKKIWIDYAKIYSLKQSDSGTGYEFVISNPMEPSERLTLYGTVTQ